LYLPALRKVRRVSASDRGDWFLGTDFSYEDIKKETKVSKEDYDFKLLGEEELDGHAVYKMELVTKSTEIAKELGYSKLISWVDKNIFINRKVDYYDNRGELLKKLHNQKITEVDGIWTIHHMHMSNQQNGHESHFYFSNLDYKTALSDSLFSQQALKRGK
jgi:outer membrane lipoprotein-sorting protein